MVRGGHGLGMASQGSIRVIKIRVLRVHDIFKFEESAPISYACQIIGGDHVHSRFTFVYVYPARHSACHLY